MRKRCSYTTIMLEPPDNQFNGYILHQQRDLVSVKLVDENTLRLWYARARFGGS